MALISMPTPYGFLTILIHCLLVGIGWGVRRVSAKEKFWYALCIEPYPREDNEP